MILYRYMSGEEFRAFLKGKTLVSEVDHKNYHRSTSVGYCFLGENTEFDSIEGRKSFSPDRCLEFLTGIVSEDILACFDFPDELVTQAKGTYSDPFGRDDELIEIVEYNVKEYSKKNCKLLKISIPTYSGDCEFDWFKPILTI